MIGRISRLQHFSVGDGPGIRQYGFFFRAVTCTVIGAIIRKLFPSKRRCCFTGSAVQPAGTVCRLVQKKCHRLASGCHAFSRTACNLCGACVEACTPQALERCGQEMTLDEVFRFIEEDQDFYAASGGGVTLSGGEPLLQADFCGELVKNAAKVK